MREGGVLLREKKKQRVNGEGWRKEKEEEAE